MMYFLAYHQLQHWTTLYCKLIQVELLADFLLVPEMKSVKMEMMVQFNAKPKS